MGCKLFPIAEVETSGHFFISSFFTVLKEKLSPRTPEQASHLWVWRRLPHNIQGPWVWKVRDGPWTLAGGPCAGYEVQPPAWSVAPSVSWEARAQEQALCPLPPRHWRTQPPTCILILSSVPPVQILPPPHSQSVGSSLSELQISQLLNLCLPRGAQRQSPILVQSYISLGCPPTWPLSQAPSLGIQSCPLLILLPPLGWVFRLLLGLLMITMI